jgi:hypothetical protein
MLTGNGVIDDKNRMYLSCYFGSDHKMYRRYGEKSGIVRIDVSDRVLPTAAAPVFHPYGGRFIGSITVSLKTASSGAEIRYTIDGSDPNPQSQLYTTPIRLDRGTFVRARAFLEGAVKSPEAHALFINAEN